MTTVITKIKLNLIHEKLAWYLKRNEQIFAKVIRLWFVFAVKQIQADLKSKFQKDITSDITDWSFIEIQGESVIKPAVLKITQSGGNAAYRVFGIESVFDILNVDAVRAAEKFTAKLVREVTKETKKGIRTFITAGIKEGKSMNKIAREIRPLVGLTGRQTQSVINYKALLQDKEKFPRLSVSDIDKKVQQYTDKTHRRRTITIARTESARAQNIGYVQGMDDLGVKELEFSAILDDRTAIVCINLNRTKFSVKDAAGIIPVHPNCRCAMLPVVEGGTISKPLKKPPSGLDIPPKPISAPVELKF